MKNEGDSVIIARIVKGGAAEKSGKFVFFFFFFFSTVLFPGDFSHEKFGLLSLGKARGNRGMLLNLQCMLGVLVIS